MRQLRSAVAVLGERLWCVSEARIKAAVVVLTAAASWALPFVTYVPADFVRFLDPWYQHILSAGPLGAFSEPFGNYSPPYLYLLTVLSLFDGLVPVLFGIKFLSAAGAAWLAFAVSRLTERPEAGAWSLLLPTIAINVALLAQADCFWLAPCVLAVLAVMEERPVAAALWASVGFAIKAQAVFIAPFIAVALIQQRAPIWAWFAPLPVYLVAILPAWLAGWPFSDLLTVYVRQAQWQQDGHIFISTAPNIWLPIKIWWPSLYSIPLGLSAAGIAGAAYVALLGKRRVATVPAAALSAALLPFLLPGMHERFFALTEILTFCLAWMDRRFVVVAIGSQAAFVLTLAGISGSVAPSVAAIAAEVFVIIFLTSYVSGRSKGDVAPAVGHDRLRQQFGPVSVRPDE